MWNPFTERLTLTISDVITMLGQKEAELIILRGQLQHAMKVIEDLRAAAK